MAVAGAVASAAGAIISAQQQAKGLEYQGEVAENQAEMARDIAAIEARRARLRGEYAKGEARAKFAKAGVAMEGTPLLVMEDLTAQLEHDVRIIKYGGRVQAVGRLAEADLYNMRARQAREAGYFKAAGSLLTLSSSFGGGGAGTSPMAATGISGATSGASVGSAGSTAARAAIRIA
jgi:hypothetical protein